jgi:hypothetical protein
MNHLQARLLFWPVKFAQEEFDCPSEEILALAHKVAEIVPEGSTVVTDGDGGVVFELLNSGTAWRYHVWDDGIVEFTLRKQGQTIGRVPMRFMSED